MYSLQLQLYLSTSPLSLPQPKYPKPLSHVLLPHQSLLPGLTPYGRRSLYAAAANTTATEAAQDDVPNGTPAAVPAAWCSEEQGSLPEGLQRELMPNHVAVIMDGNRRWARMRGLPVGLGHEAGVRALREIVELCCKWGIRVLTAFAFSCDNWFRPQVSYLNFLTFS